MGTKKTNCIDTPIKRLPGQGLREERDRLFEELINEPLMICFVSIVFLVVECLHVFSPIKPSVWIGVGVAVLATVYAVRKCIIGRRELRNYRRGEEGERIVAQAIEQYLIPVGYKVIHDIPVVKDGHEFNVDHLVIGTNGVFAIETKNYAKPDRGSPIVRYDGDWLYWNGKRHKRDEAAQARSAAAAARECIARKLGMNLYVHPVLCAVGWCANSSNLYGHPVLLVMEKTLGTVIPKVAARQTLTEEDQRRICSALM